MAAAIVRFRYKGQFYVGAVDGFAWDFGEAPHQREAARMASVLARQAASFGWWGYCDQPIAEAAVVTHPKRFSWVRKPKPVKGCVDIPAAGAGHADTQ